MKVIFPIEKKQGSNEIVYPDGIKHFSDSKIVGSNIIADYNGSLPLTKYVPEQKSIPDTATMTDQEFKKLVLEKLGIECK
jgi:hypothetical protein